MKPTLFVSLTASLLFLGSTAVFAQQYAATDAVTLKPGEAMSPAAVSSAAAPRAATVDPNVGIVFLKPGETVNTASPQDLGAVSAGATRVPGGSFQLVKPGQAG
jgi:hypothetical protein